MRAVSGESAAARALLSGAHRVVVFTGAGVSAESGVPTFRGPGGLWKTFRPEQLATPKAFARDPRLVWEWYGWRRELLASCRPNLAHVALARWMLQREGVTLVTQNVDDLHERAGTPELMKLHGSLFEDRCSGCGRAAAAHRRTDGPTDRDDGTMLPLCPECGALLRPGVVWFGEMLPPDALARAYQRAGEANAVLVIGTTGAVYPAAGIVHEARAEGAAIIVVDPGQTEYDAVADIRLTGPAGELVPPLLA